MIEVDAKTTNTTALAYLGDAVYEVYVRTHVLEEGMAHVDRLNRKAIRLVCADGQAVAARQLMEGFLTDEETRLLKRGRNHTQTGHPRGTRPIDYKLATGFEALIGYLYLAGKQDRLREIIAEAIRIIERSEESKSEKERT